MSRMPIQHQAIMAAAGSGKTYQLAHRYIRLLHLGVEPSAIIALTFSRKAAGEIFSSIVSHLCEAAMDADKAKEKKDIIGEVLSTDRYAELLAGLLRDLHRTRISTIDSFQVGILRAFALEWGLPPNFAVTDSKQIVAAKVRLATRRHIVRMAERHDQVRDAMLRAFRDANPQSAAARVSQSLDQLIENLSSRVRALPDAGAWGSENRIWPNPEWWSIRVPAITVQSAIAHLRSSYLGTLEQEFARGKWSQFLDVMTAWQPEQPWEDIGYLAEKLLLAHLDLLKGTASIKLSRTVYSVSGADAQAMLTLATHIMGEILRAKMKATAGAYQLVEAFRGTYDLQMREAGILTFDDVPYLLTSDAQGVTSPAQRLADLRTDIQYRLDGLLDHWLIDEFQDTSDQQWRVLSELIDEVIQDTSKRRSIFLVGDIKQSIYGFRGGNPKLFEHVLQQHQHAFERMNLATSFRSQEPILRTVNQVFKKQPEVLPESVWRRWQQVWKPHHMSPDKRTQSAYTALIEAGADKSDKDAVFDACAALLNEIHPLRRGLSVAILVSKNDTGKALANHLRTCCEMPITTEGRAKLADHPVVMVMLSLLQYALHPGDRMAHEHVRMSPLRERFEREGQPLSLLQAIQDQGLPGWIRDWSTTLITSAHLDVYSRARLNRLIDAAYEFDADAQVTLNDFIPFIRSYELSEEATASSVRVMTLHAAKGLGFDIVIMPELGRQLNASARTGVQLHFDEDDEAQWALDMPVGEIVDADPVLKACRQRQVETDSFENLCGLYVGMTRAKRALYLIDTPPPKSDSCNRYSSYLRQQLANQPPTSSGVLYEAGQADWYASEKLQTPSAQVSEKAGPINFRAKQPLKRRWPSGSPSSRSESARPGSTLFDADVRKSLRVGTIIHGLFEQITWLDEVSAEQAITQWESKQEPLEEDFRQLFRTALQSADFQTVLTRPHGACKVWREQPFEAILDGHWVTGTIDRAILHLNSEGRVLSADIIDYKTNQAPDDAAIEKLKDHYRPQLRLYAEALGKLTGLEVDQISLNLALVRAGRVVKL